MRRWLITFLLLLLIAWLVLIPGLLSDGSKVMASQSIETSLVRVWHFDSIRETWLLYDPAIPVVFNTLNKLDKGKEYFILMKTKKSVVNGSGVLVALVPGWNKIVW